MPINENDSNYSLFNQLDFFYVELYLLYFLENKVFVIYIEEDTKDYMPIHHKYIGNLEHLSLPRTEEQAHAWLQQLLTLYISTILTPILSFCVYGVPIKTQIYTSFFVCSHNNELVVGWSNRCCKGK